MKIPKIIESSGILFSGLLFFAAIVFAASFTTWSPGSAPLAGPGEGNVEISSSGAGRGFVSGLTSYCDDSVIIFQGGSVEIDGQVYNLENQVGVSLISPNPIPIEGSPLGIAWNYVYIDPPSSGTTLSLDDFEITTTAPEWVDSKASWRHPSNSDWRAIGVYAFYDGSFVPFYVSGGKWIFKNPAVDGLIFDGEPPSTLTSLATGLPDLGKLLVDGHTTIYSQTSNFSGIYICNGDATERNNACDYSVAVNVAATTIHVRLDWEVLTSNSQNLKIEENGSEAARIFVKSFELPTSFAR